MGYDLNPGEDLRLILAAAATMLEEAYPLSRLRGDTPDDLAAVAGFGAFGLALPEEAGGSGLSLVEEALLHVRFGRHVLSPRSLATPLAARLSRLSGRDDMAAEIVAGRLPVCPAIPSGGGLLLIDPARLALVFGDRSLALAEIPEGAGASVAGLAGELRLHRVEAARELARSAAPELLHAADVLVSAQLLGLAEAARDLAVAYAGIRRQFGKPIGAFQAIKHHCSTMAIEAEKLSALLDIAAIAARDGREDADFQIAALRRLAPRAALSNARTGIQIHGGIGFSAEADAHRFLKQAHVLSRLGGGADLLGLPPSLGPVGERTAS